MPSARTSVANEKDEGKKNDKQQAARLQQAVGRRETIRCGDAEVVVALRHGSNLKQDPRACQLFSYDDSFLACPPLTWTA